MRDTTSSITIHIAGEANHAVLLPNAAIVHKEQIAKSKQNNDFLIVLLYCQLSSNTDANSVHPLTYLSHFLYVIERTEVTRLSWGMREKFAELCLLLICNFSAK